MNKNTVIFDLDGTLLNTLKDIQISFNYALKNCGYKEYNLNDVREFVGNGIKIAFERAVGQGADINKLIEIFKNHYITQNKYTKPYDGIIGLLKELKKKKFDMAVVSNKYDEAVKKLCRKYFNDYISIAVGESRKIHRKPSDDGIKQVLRELGKNISDVIYIGDSEVDIETAKNAGVECISVLWGFKDRHFLEKCGGYIFAEKPMDIIKILDS